MNATLYKAVVVVTFALIFYSIGIITEQRNHAISRRVLGFLSAGVACDIASTGLMIIGSGKIPITVHGFIGYSALIVMLIDTILIWRLWTKNRVKITNVGFSSDAIDDIPQKLHIYTRLAYIWWIIAYIAGAFISMTLD